MAHGRKSVFLQPFTSGDRPMEQEELCELETVILSLLSVVHRRSVEIDFMGLLSIFVYYFSIPRERRKCDRDLPPFMSSHYLSPTDTNTYSGDELNCLIKSTCLIINYV